MRDGEWFEGACRAVLRVWPLDPKRIQARHARLRKRLDSLDVNVRAVELDAEVSEAGAGERKVLLASLDRMTRERDRIARLLAQDSFHRAVEYAQLHVSLEGVLRFALMAAIASAATGLVALIVAVLASTAIPMLAMISAISVVSPIAAYAGVASYPESLSRRMRVGAVGGAPEAVNYMAMSMRVVPSLDRAIDFAAQNTEEPLASRLRHVLWRVYLRAPAGVEAAYLRFSREWGDWQEEAKRAFSAIAAAAVEKTEAGLDRALDQARKIVFEGTKARMQEYAAGLRAPTTALFALGVLLPLMIGAMLPVISLGGIAPNPTSFGRPVQGPDNGLTTVLALDVLFPLGTFAYAYRILGNRPGTNAPIESRSLTSKWPMFVAFVLVAVSGLVFAMAATVAGALLSLWLIVVAGLLVTLPGVGSFEKKRRTVTTLDAEFPDVLFLLGSRIAEGVPVERAFQMTEEAARGTEVVRLFGRIVRRLQTSRSGLEKALLPPDGILNEVPSRTVRAALRMVVEVGRKDPATAGKAIMETSAYLRDVQEIDREMRRDLSSTTDAMQMTAAVFAPIVLGVTCALYGLLTKAFSRLIVLGLTPGVFVGAVGVYLILTVAVITYFRVGIARGRNSLELRGQLGRAWPLSMAVFSAALLVSQAGLAG